MYAGKGSHGLGGLYSTIGACCGNNGRRDVRLELEASIGCDDELVKWQLDIVVFGKIPRTNYSYGVLAVECGLLINWYFHLRRK